jgi:iron complex outermembrane recepter protein
MRRFPLILLYTYTLVALGAAASAQDQPGLRAAGAPLPSVVATSGDPLDQRGVVTGVIVDAVTGDPLPGAAVRIRELGRGQATDAEGRFRFENVPARTYTVAAQFLGYLPAEQRIQVATGETVALRFALEASSIDLPGVVVIGMGRERGIADTYRPTDVLTGRELERSLAPSLGETLRRVPGLHPVYNGPAATRPTIRGMGGDRVLILEDGQRTGDMSATAPDHGVASDPISAERIEVVRGPAGLLYGPNALGGVINVWREEVPRSRPQALTGTVSTTAESVNRGVGGHVLVQAPAGPAAVRFEASARGAGDTRTPLGVLPSTDLSTFSVAGGASLVPEWGFVGLAYRYYDSAYGVPGTFNGETIPGAHEGGVDIEMRRHVLRAQGAHLLGVGPFDTVELDAHLTHYQHEEIEGRGPEGQALVGAAFDQLSGAATLTGRHSHDLEAFQVEGAVGVSGMMRDLIAGGGYTGTRSATETTAAAFAYEEFQRARLRLQVGARYDIRLVSPRSDRPIEVGGRQIPVRDRTFGNVSASVALLYDLRPGWTLGASVARAFRSPAVEELYSDGPHLADYSFDIGNPELGSEVGHGADVFFRVARPRTSLEVAAFANRVSNYIYYRPTGEIDDRFRRFPVFQATADDAMFLGFEGRAQVEVLPRFILDGTAGYVRATRLDHGDPLPAIPPLTANVEVRYETRRLFASLGYEAGAPQRRVPGPIDSPVAPNTPGTDRLPERPTDGYGLLNATVGSRFELGGMHHSVTLQGRNLTDAVWRDHLSRIKDVAPQPGRNVQLVYRVQF